MEVTRATILWCLLLCVLVAEISGAKRGTSKVVYGSDDRKDYFEVSSSDKELGTGVALLLTGSNIFSQSGSTYTPRGTADAEEWWDLCASDRFSDQLVIEANVYCSGFLISSNPPWIATAAHCTDSVSYVVFDYDELEDGPRLSFDEDEIYQVTRVVEVGRPTGGVGDFGILELDREVTGRTVYGDIASSLALGDSVQVIGHPIGLPKKFDRGGKITELEEDLIHATVDTFGGNSGSPVFDEDGRLVGILVGGSTDFVETNGCQQTNVCPGGPGCDIGESIVPICDLVSDNSESANTLQWDCNVEFSTGVEPDDEGNNGSSFLFPSFMLLALFALLA